MSIHIGKIIEKVLKESPLTVAKFAERMGYSRNSIYRIFGKENINTGLLEKIGEILEHNFFQYFSNKQSDKDIKKALKEISKFSKTTRLKEKKKQY